MAIARRSIPDFALANPLYVQATVTFYLPDVNGIITATPATLYAEPTGGTTLPNPQTLDGEGKFAAPVYINFPVIGVVSGPNVSSHQTGVIGTRGTWRGVWTTATIYYSSDLVQHPSTLDVYVAIDDHLSAASIASDIGGHLELVLNWSALGVPSDHVNITHEPYGAVGDGVTDDSAAVQAAWDTGKMVYAPTPSVGYRIATPVSFLAGAEQTAGIKMYGDGALLSRFICEVENDAAFTIGQTAAFVFSLGGFMEQVGFYQEDPLLEDQTCFKLEGVWKYRFRDLYMGGFSGDIVQFPFASIGLTIDEAQIETASARIVVPENLTLDANIHPNDRVVGVGIPDNVIVTRVDNPDTIFISNPATQTGTVSLQFIGNPDGNSSAFNEFDQVTIERGAKWGIRDYTDGGVVHFSLRNSSVALNRSGNMYWRSSALDVFNNRIYSGVEDGLTECKGPGIYLTGSATTGGSGAKLSFNEFDGNFSANIHIDNFTNVQIIENNRSISHNYEQDKNMRPLRGIRIAPIFTIPDCNLVSGSAIVSNSLTVAGVGTTSGSNVVTGDFSGATQATQSPYSSGDRITGTGIPSGTFISTINGTTSAALTKKCTANGTITATVTHGFDALVYEGMPCVVNPRQKIDVRTIEGSPILTIVDPNAFGGNNFGDCSVGEQVYGLGFAAASIPTGATILSVDSATQITITENATFSRDRGAQIEIIGPEVPIGTTVESVQSDGSFTMSAEATDTATVELSFGRVGNRVANVTIDNIAFRTNLLYGDDNLPYPFIGIDWVGSQVADNYVDKTIGLLTGAITEAGTPFSLPPNSPLPSIDIRDRGVDIQSLGHTPHAYGHLRWQNQLILPNVTTAVLMDDENFDRTLFTSSDRKAFKLPFIIENVSFTISDPDITATAMPLKAFDGTSGQSTLTATTFDIGSLTTNATTTVTRGAGSFITDGVRVGMYVTGTDMDANARVESVAALSIVLTVAATGSTAGTATLSFEPGNLKHLVAAGATIEHANIPASTTVLSISDDGTELNLSAALTGNITAGSVDIFNLTGLVEGDVLTLSTQSGTQTLDTALPSLIVGTPTKTAATMDRGANATGTRSIYARSYKTPSIRSYRIVFTVTLDGVTTGSKVTLSIGSSTIVRTRTFYAAGPGTLDDHESFTIDTVALIGKNFALMPYLKIEDSVAREIVANQAFFEFAVTPVT